MNKDRPLYLLEQTTRGVRFMQNVCAPREFSRYVYIYVLLLLYRKQRAREGAQKRPSVKAKKYNNICCVRFNEVYTTITAVLSAVSPVV